MKFFKLTLKMLFVVTFLTQTSYTQTTFNGNLDIYYRYEFNNPQLGTGGNSYTSFTKSSNSFELGMASIKASHKAGKASLFVDLGFGNRAKEFSYNDKDAFYIIKQANLTYEFNSNFKVTAGSFPTHIGYELLDPADNKNYSMSYAFTNGPFFNTGVKGQATFGKFSAMLGLSNLTDFKSALDAGTDQKAVISQLGYSSGEVVLLLGATISSANPKPENYAQVDFVGTYKPTEKVSLALNATYGNQTYDTQGVKAQKFFALVGYFTYMFNSNYSISYRAEYFDDKDGLKLGFIDSSTNSFTGYETNVFANTLSLSIKEGNFTFIPEIRLDAASKEIFSKKNGDVTKTSPSILLATTYTF